MSTDTFNKITKAIIDAFEEGYRAGATTERENMVKEGWRRCAVGQKTTQFCGMLENAVKAEREACAKACKKVESEWSDDAGTRVSAYAWGASLCRKAIRARGET